MENNFSDAFTFLMAQKDIFPWDVLLSPRVKLTKRYFRELAVGKLSVDNTIQSVSPLFQKSNCEERLAIQLALYLHADHQDVAEIIKHDCLAPISPKFLGSGSISSTDYDLIVENLGGDAGFKCELKAAAPSTGLPESEHVPETDKELVHRLKNGDLLLLSDEKYRDRRDGLVQQVYSYRIFGGFAKQIENAILSSLCIRARTMATVTGAERQKFLDKVYIAVFQEPFRVVTALVNTSIRLKHGFLLQEIPSFLQLPVGMNNRGRDYDTPLLHYVLLESMLGFDDSNPLWNFYSSGLRTLADQDFIKTLELLRLLQTVTMEFAGVNDISNIINSIKLLKTILQLTLDKGQLRTADVVKSYEEFVRLLKYCTHMTDATSPVLRLRDVLITVHHLLRDNLKETITEASADKLSLEGRSVLELGLIYTRFPERQEDVKEILNRKSRDPSFGTDEVTDRRSKEITTLIKAASHAESKAVTDFIVFLGSLNYLKQS